MPKSPATIRKESLVSAELARSLLDYNPGTGIITWKPRPVLKQQDKGWNSRCAGKTAGNLMKTGYIRLAIANKSYQAHRVAWLMHTGEWPEEEIDHIDHDPANNRISNLRDVSHKQNGRNMSLPRNNTSGVIGIGWDRSRGKWSAKSELDGRTVNLGRFDSLSAASEERTNYELRHGFHQNHGVASGG
jgi:hypothetical protein